MGNQLKMRLTNLFRSCKSKKINTDVFQQQPAAACYHHPPFTSLVNVGEFFELESLENFPTYQNPSTASARTKLCVGSRSQRDHHHHHHHPHELTTDVESQMCPHPALATQKFRGNEQVKTSCRRRRKKIRSRSSRSFGIINYEFPLCNYNGLFSEDEDEDDDRTAFFSSRSFSSDSTKDRHRNRNRKSNKTAKQKKMDNCVLPQGIAVVRHSKDPYADFMNSMIEMITQHQIFGTDELEKLLLCFLSLNSDQHHRIIIHVFKDIWGALFTNY